MPGSKRWCLIPKKKSYLLCQLSELTKSDLKNIMFNSEDFLGNNKNYHKFTCYHKSAMQILKHL